nr:MAG TPA: hypothetical protein [Caudoviricetes sp.]
MPPDKNGCCNTVTRETPFLHAYIRVYILREEYSIK